MISWPSSVPTLMDGDLILRPWSDSDMDAVFEICQDPTIQLLTTVPVPYLRVTADEFFVHQARGFDMQDSISFAGVMNGEVVASFALHHCIHFDHVCELGYWVAPDARGNGYAHRGAVLATNFAFSIGFRRVQAITLPENPGSQKTLLKAGFEMETVLRQGMTRRDETQTDAVMFAKFPPVVVES